MFEPRIRRLREQLTKEKLDGVLISAVSNISYLSGFTNFSKDEREAYIFIGSDFAYIITDARYAEAVKKEVPHLTTFERGNNKSTETLFKKHKNKIKRLGIEEGDLTVLEHKVLNRHFKNIKHFNVSHLRSIKTKEEIKKIEKACKIGDLAFKYILKKIKAGVTEKGIARELEQFIRAKGAEFSFPPIVAFGKNSSVPHHQTGDTILENKEGQFILLDFGIRLDSYCSDMTRTVFLGKPTKEQKKIYNTVLTTQQKAIGYINSALKSGKKLKASDVDKIARGYIIDAGYPTIPHSLGHGIGLEVHEYPSLSPRSKEELKEGMVFSIEPGIYIPDFGGVRIEDLYVIQKGKLKQITKAVEKMISL